MSLTSEPYSSVYVTFKLNIMSAGRLCVLHSHSLGHVEFGLEIDHKRLYIKCEMFISQQLPTWWTCDVIPDICNIGIISMYVIIISQKEIRQQLLQSNRSFKLEMSSAQN
jgi:hypothetical protein